MSTVTSPAAPPIEEVTLARRWPGTNDFLNLTLSRSGEALCSNGWPTWPVRGEHTGALGAGDLDEVCALIDGLDLEALAGTLDAPRFLNGPIALGWRRRDGTTTSIECTESDAPVALQAVALAAEAVGRRVLWNPVEGRETSQHHDLPAAVPERYAFLYDPLSLARTSLEELAAALPYERIELERSECYGTCPAYLLRLDRNGSATWEGRANSEPGGHHVGEVRLDEFAQICWFVEAFDLKELAGDYSADWTDDQTTWIRLVRPDGETLTFRDYGRRSPIEVLALTDLLELVARRNGWARYEPTPAVDAIVLEVDAARELVVLDKGQRDGVRVGNAFDVFLGSTYKGRVTVEEVRDTTSEARILLERYPIAAGDSATTQL